LLGARGSTSEALRFWSLPSFGSQKEKKKEGYLAGEKGKKETRPYPFDWENLRSDLLSFQKKNVFWDTRKQKVRYGGKKKREGKKPGEGELKGRKCLLSGKKSSLSTLARGKSGIVVLKKFEKVEA